LRVAGRVIHNFPTFGSEVIDFCIYTNPLS